MLALLHFAKSASDRGPGIFTHACPQWLKNFTPDNQAIVVWVDLTKLGTVTKPQLDFALDVVKTDVTKHGVTS